MLRLTAKLLKKPAFARDEFEEAKRDRLAQIQSQEAAGQSVANREAQRYLSCYPSGHGRYVPTHSEELRAVKKIEVSDLRRFHRQFYGVTQGEAAFVGTFDGRRVDALLEELFGRWPGKTPYVRIPRVYKATRGKSKFFEVPGAASAGLAVSGNLELCEKDPDYAPLMIANEIFGGGFDSRLIARLRQKEGWSYDVRTSVSANVVDAVGEFMLFASAAPQNIAKVEQAVRQEVARAAREGFTPQEIERAKSSLVQANTLQRSNEDALADQMAFQLHLGRDYSWETDYEARIAAATSADIRKAFRRHIDLSTMFTATWRDPGLIEKARPPAAKPRRRPGG